MEVAREQAGNARGGQHDRRQLWLLAMLLAALALAMLVALGMGAVRVPLRALVESATGFRPLSADQRVILFAIRLPRIIAAVLIGSGLSVSGLLFQGLFRNPLADPYVIGSSGGALLGAALGVFLLSAVSVAGFGTTALLALRVLWAQSCWFIGWRALTAERRLWPCSWRDLR